MSRPLRVDALVSRGACPSAVAEFRALLGERAEVTRELCVKHADDFSGGWWWAARNLLSPAAGADWKRTEDDALVEFQAAEEAADAAMQDAVVAAANLRLEADPPAPDEYVRAMKIARAAYAGALTAARKKLAAARAAAFADAYIGDVGVSVGVGDAKGGSDV